MSRGSGKLISSILESAEIEINGSRPFDIQVHNEKLYDRVLAGGTLAVGESYMDGWWDCEALDQFFDRVFRANLDERIKSRKELLWHFLRARLLNPQKIQRSYQVGRQHYDVGNEFYKAMLGKEMVYTCGYWKHADNLDDAQRDKLDLVCRKLDLKPGMSVLDLGCGWGAFARYAAENYGARVTGVTVSREQADLANQLSKGLPVEIKLEDYRNVEGTYDRVISIGMLEHVGYKNYRTYLEAADRNLKEGGLVFIHTIGNNVSTKGGNAWTTKYIFPNSMLPSIAQIGRAMEGLFVMEDWHNFGPDYDKTLMVWYDNFEKNWPRFKDKYGERFRRMWRFYLLSSAGAFRSRMIQLWQVVMTRPGSPQPECRLV